MIHISDKSQCVGCWACVQRCPKHCISMNEDEEGFLYPKADESLCVDCGICDKVCPIINQSKPRKPLNVYAAKNTNEEIRLKSSSGGIFTLLAEKILEQKGVVFGAKFNDKWDVVHGYVETLEELAAFRGSKYVQSQIGDCYKIAETFLNQGRQLLFSGTSCQIAGLKLFLKREYENLLTIDIVCHGVPSPLIWREYLNEILKRPKGVFEENSILSSLNTMSMIKDISFRDKSTGWKKFGFVIQMSAFKADKNSILSSYNFLHETLDKNLFMQGFLKNLYLRPSCYACPSKCGKSGSDITIADFWGIQNILPEFDDDKGVGLVLINTEKGKSIYAKINAQNIETTYSKAFVGNPPLEKSAIKPKYRADFWEEYKNNGIFAITKTCEKIKSSILHQLIDKLKQIVKK